MAVDTVEPDKATEVAERIMDLLFPPSPALRPLTIHDAATDFRVLNPLTGTEWAPDPESLT